MGQKKAQQQQQRASKQQPKSGKLQGSKQQRCHSSSADNIRCFWTTTDPEVLEVLPPSVQRMFTIVLNAGAAMTRDMFDDMVHAVTTGQSFSQYIKGVEHQQQTLYMRTLEQWLDYRLKVPSTAG